MLIKVESKKMNHLLKVLLLIFLINSLAANNCIAQNILQKKITVSVSNEPLSNLLSLVEKVGNFSFSYNSSLFNTDSVVSLEVKNRTILNVLHSVFGNRFQYHEQNNHVIISPATSRNKSEINGIITDRLTRKPVPYATVFERRQLVAAMTDEQGNFSLNLKKRSNTDSISVSRISYADTIVPLRPEDGNNIEIPITMMDKSLDSVVVQMMQRSWLSKSILSSQQIVNSINLNQFFTKQPFQISLLPGIGSHGKMSSQFVNKFSFNLLGGYNGGVNGLELAGLYNITNRDVRYVQVAGLFNKVGGKAEGLQLAGLFNKDSAMKGFQAAGLFNKTVKTHGFQMAAFNKNDTMQGFQAGAVNLNRKFKGVQIGIINVADTIEGIPIGLVNIGKSGIHNLSLSYNEMGFGLVSYKSGNPKFYNILVAGSSLNFNEKAFSIGYGFGKEMNISNAFSINPELTSLFFVNGNKEKQNISARLQLNFQLRISKSFSLYAGPAITALYSKPGIIPDGYKEDLSNGAHNFSVAKNTIGWFGWNVGINLF